MRGFIDWLLHLGRVTGSQNKAVGHSLVVERLEPRQMLAVDCFFMVEVHPAEMEYNEHCTAGTYVDSMPSERLDDVGVLCATNLSSGSVLDDIEEYYLIYLEDVLDEIGELLEIQETAFGDFDDLNFSWFS
jgi:hypothetical protein